MREKGALLTFGHISCWHTDNITDMSRLFEDCSTFNSPIHYWNVGNVTNMHHMFCRAISFNQSLSDWNVRKVTSMKEMFHGATSFNQPLNDWKLDDITDMSSMFYEASSFNQELDSWHQCIDPVTVKVVGMLHRAKSFTHFPHVTTRFPFTNKTLYKKIQALIHGQSDYTTEQFWYGPMSEWDTSRVTDMSNLFHSHYHAGDATFNIDISKWDVRRVTKMTKMFANTKAFNQPLNDWKLESITDMSYMFYNARSFNQPLDNWLYQISDPVQKVNTKLMFHDAVSFTHFPEHVTKFPFTNETLRKVIKGLCYAENDGRTERYWFGPIGLWDTTRVTDMSKLFQYAQAFNHDISGWDVSNVIDMNGMFNGARVFNQPLNAWDVSKVINMEEMFARASLFNQTMDEWILNANVNTKRMFADATAFNESEYGRLWYSKHPIPSEEAVQTTSESLLEDANIENERIY